MTTLVMPRGPQGRHEIDLDTLTPKARALAEAIAQTSQVRITVRSVATLRDLITNPDAARLVFTDDELDRPETRGWEGWMDARGWARSVHEILEYEARKLRGWYPVADDGTELPSSAAAREDDGIIADQVMQLLAQTHLPISKDRWMRSATKGLDGYPAPVRHNGYHSLWSERTVREWIALLTPLAEAGAAWKVVQTEEIAAGGRARTTALALIEERGLPESLIADIARVQRGTVRAWQGKDKPARGGGWSLRNPQKSGTPLRIEGATLIDAIERNFPAIARELGVHQRGGYVLTSVVLRRGSGLIGGQVYAELTVTASPSQDLPKDGATDQTATYTAQLFGVNDADLPEEPYHLEIG